MSYATDQRDELLQRAELAELPYEADALKAMARSWDNCEKMPSLTDKNGKLKTGTELQAAQLERDYLLRCTEFALRDAQIFSSLAVARQHGNLVDIYTPSTP